MRWWALFVGVVGCVDVEKSESRDLDLLELYFLWRRISNYPRWIALEVVGTCIEDRNGGHLSRRLPRFSQDERAHVDESAKTNRVCQIRMAEHNKSRETVANLDEWG